MYTNHHHHHSLIQCRSQSQEKLVDTSKHRRSNSSHSVDLFTLVIPTNTTDSSLSSLICPICSLPMLKPTLLPCQHTFCFQCIENTIQTRPGSLPIHSTHSLSSHDHQIRTITCRQCSTLHRINSLTDLQINQSIQLLINTLLCEICHQLYPSNQLDTCFHCFHVLCPKCYEQHLATHQKDLITNRILYRIVSTDETVNINENSVETISKPDEPKLINTDKKVGEREKKRSIQSASKQNIADENTDPAQLVNTKRKTGNFIAKLKDFSRHRHSTTKERTMKTSSAAIKQTSSDKVSRRSAMTIDIKSIEPTKAESAPCIVPVTPVSRFRSFNDQYIHTTHHIKQCKQRQSELDRSVRKLIEVFTLKSNETIHQITQYWMHLKQLSLDQFQEKTNRFQFFNYLLKTCCSTLDSHSQIASYFEQNDEIKAAIQVLLTTIVIVNEQQTQLTISELFDREEQTTIGRLRRQLDFLLSSYVDELSFILERINVYDSRFAEWKTCNTTDLDSISYEWSQIIEHDYPSLVEKISNDFITKIPLIEKSLLEMLKNMKKCLLITENQRTSTGNL